MKYRCAFKELISAAHARAHAVGRHDENGPNFGAPLTAPGVPYGRLICQARRRLDGSLSLVSIQNNSGLPQGLAGTLRLG
jgi:hypothetical protein